MRRPKQFLKKIINHQKIKKKQMVIKTMRTKYGIKTNERK
jgi:hypothetical protein